MDSGGLLALLLGGAALLSRAKVRVEPGIQAPAKAQPYLTAIRRWGAHRQIPVPVLLAWIKRESDFKAKDYNPEVSALASWACEIADKGHKWGGNPDYTKASSLCARIRAGAEPASLASEWTFGSYGLLQVTRISASESGGYPFDARNEGLYDVETNLRVGTKTIAALRESLFPGRLDLSLEEWARVRAAYVGGRGILTRNPDKAARIAEAFVTAYRQLAA